MGLRYVDPSAGLYNYSSVTGAGSDSLSRISGTGGWRAALLGTVAAGALWVATPRAANAGPDDCDVVGSTATCQGDQSDGISSNTDFTAPPVTTLNVNELTGDIDPNAADGIYFLSPGRE